MAHRSKSELLTTREAAEYTKISEYTLRERFKEGAIKARRAGNQWRTTEQWCDDYLLAGAA